MLDHMLSSGVMHGDGRQRREEMVKHEVKKDITVVHTRYRNTDPGLFPEASAIALSEAVKNLKDVPLVKSPLITPEAISALSGAAHIFQPQATFQPTFGQLSLPAIIGATTTRM